MILPLLQLGDSALPIGGYSHSWGLEAAVARGLVADPVGLERWLRCWLEHSAGPCEGVIVAAVSRAAAAGQWLKAGEANELLAATLTPPTLRHASQQMGDQLLQLAGVWPWAIDAVTAMKDCGAGPWHHAVVFAALAVSAGAGPVDALRVYLHQATLGVLGAGVRAIPIGHTHGQQILARLHSLLERLAHELSDRELETAGAGCPAYEVLSYEQSRLYTRLFRS